MARRRFHEEGMIYNFCLLVASDIDDETGHIMTDEEFNKLSKSDSVKKQAIFNINTMDLIDRLIEEYKGTYDIQYCHEKAEYIMKNIPEELMLNVEEWLDNKPLTDIKVHGFSVNDIYNKYKNWNLHFIKILMFFIDWKRTGYQDKDFHFLYFSEI